MWKGVLLYFSTYDEEIPGEFQLYNLDFETKEYELLFESNEVLNLYVAFQDLFLISDPILESTTNIYRYNFEDCKFFVVTHFLSIFKCARYGTDVDGFNA